jgi:lysozyme
MRLTIKEQLKIEEGERLFAYVDCCGRAWRSCECPKKGKLTIGIGRNLEDVGISLAESAVLFEHDLARVRAELDQALPWWRQLDPVRQQVMEDLGFNLGVLTPIDTAKLLRFDTTLKLIEAGEYDAAADRLSGLPWAKQVQASRVARILGMLRTGAGPVII